jgi:hypothetical protein
MPPQPGEIYFLNEPKLRQSRHPHPVIIIEVVNTHTVMVNFISSEFDSFRDGKDLSIRMTDEGFQQTGLTKDSFFIEGQNLEAEISNLGRYFGKVTGDIKCRFEDWWGATL